MEISNPGEPLIPTNRFIDTIPKARNEKLSSVMRRARICELSGRGVDRAISAIEALIMPPPIFAEPTGATRVTIFAARANNEMNQEERVRACYQHACLLCADQNRMTNETLRKRLGIADSNYTIVSRIISDAQEAKLIKPVGEPRGRNASYVPYWA
jgi:ATP-dependent DNA helicase RecG